MLSVTVESGFDAAHRLLEDSGKCHNIHGHSYMVKVAVSGELDEKGMVIDFRELKQRLKSVLSVFDHSLLLNKEDPVLSVLSGYDLSIVEFFNDPTAEVLAEWIFHHLNLRSLESVIVWETVNCSAEFREGG